MAAVNASLMAMNRSSLLQWRSPERSTALGQIRNSVVPASRGLHVKCMAKGGPPSKESATPFDVDSTTPKKVSTKFRDVFAFGGPAPETINGRLAMLGFVSAVGVELASGRDLFSQISNGGVPLFIGSAVLLSVASLIPMLKGVSKESRSQAIMSSGAEMLNGRYAMIGLIALAVTEYLKGGPLIS